MRGGIRVCVYAYIPEAGANTRLGKQVELDFVNAYNLVIALSIPVCACVCMRVYACVCVCMCVSVCAGSWVYIGIASGWLCP